MTVKDILNNWIVKNLLLAVAFLLGLAVLVNLTLSIITQHNKTVDVPDMTNLTFNEAQFEASKAGVRVEIGDSVYVRQMKRGVVFSQNPKAGTKVKKGRRILLTTNAVAAKKVSMPSLVGCSMRQAKAELASKGLFLGRMSYVEDIATNNVLKQLYRNREIRPGRMIDSGSKIDLVLGLNPEEGGAYVPDVVGMKYLRAVDIVQDNSLNIGRLVFDKAVKNYSDSLNAVVYNQKPVANGMPLSMGAEVTLYLRLE